jgi:hypothetical protein
MSTGHDKELPSFWIPSKTPTVERNNFQKPVGVTVINFVDRID